MARMEHGPAEKRYACPPKCIGTFGVEYRIYETRCLEVVRVCPMCGYEHKYKKNGCPACGYLANSGPVDGPPDALLQGGVEHGLVRYPGASRRFGFGGFGLGLGLGLLTGAALPGYYPGYHPSYAAMPYPYPYPYPPYPPYPYI
jgi:hypothetical protein